MYRSISIICFVLIIPFPAFAGLSDAREVARINNCQPKKIEVIQNFLGNRGKTVYRVMCNLPKTTSESPTGPDAILVGCDQSLCEFMRPVSTENK